MFLNILLALTLTVAASAHTVTVTGVFICGTNDRLPVFVELMEHDPFKDDRLQWLHTSVLEIFEIKGSEVEYRYITPYLRVNHKCNGSEETLFINLGKREGEQLIDIGEVDLEDPEIQNIMLHKFVTN